MHPASRGLRGPLLLSPLPSLGLFFSSPLHRLLQNSVVASPVSSLAELLSFSKGAASKKEMLSHVDGSQGDLTSLSRQPHSKSVFTSGSGMHRSALTSVYHYLLQMNFDSRSELASLRFHRPSLQQAFGNLEGGSDDAGVLLPRRSPETCVLLGQARAPLSYLLSQGGLHASH